MRERGHTLLEVLVVLAVLMTVIGAVGPSYRVAMEQTRVDAGAAMLHSIWHAQRLHWLESRTYAKTLAELVGEGTLDAAVASATAPFSFEILSANPKTFRARARRGGSKEWSGTLTIDEQGALDGWVEDAEGRRVEPET